MTPTNDQIQAALEMPGGLGMAPHLQTTLWRAWVGFNLSHSLGVVLGALFIGIPALQDFDAALDTTWWVVLALAVPPTYLVISLRHWFRDPTIGITVGTLLTTTGILGGLIT